MATLKKEKKQDEKKNTKASSLAKTPKKNPAKKKKVLDTSVTPSPDIKVTPIRKKISKSAQKVTVGKTKISTTKTKEKIKDKVKKEEEQISLSQVKEVDAGGKVISDESSLDNIVKEEKKASTLAPEVKFPEKTPEFDLPKKEEKVHLEKSPFTPAPTKTTPVEVEIPTLAPPARAVRELQLSFPITIKDLAVKMQEKPSVLIRHLMDIKVMASINHALDEKAVEYLCSKMGFSIKLAPDEEESALLEHQRPDEPSQLVPRPPVVTFMGHVDHGKTSLLDAIRKTKVAQLEHGGITQHIGAYSVKLEHGVITFLDTPGHEAFTAMRARGASVTDIVVLVVAADDGVMPQTKEAIDHARAAGVTIIVALNKIDKPQANPDMVKKQLAELGLLAEDWGGKTIMVPVSAKTQQGINELLEMILLEAQMLELKANPSRPARGVVIEAKLTKGKGAVATLLVKNGTLRLNDSIIVGEHYAKIRAMFNAQGQRVYEVLPAFAVEILGLSGVPLAGEEFFAVPDEATARRLALARQEKKKQAQLKTVKRINLEDLHQQIKEGKIKELRLIIKADVQGSLEAIRGILAKLNLAEIKLDIIHEGVGSINSSDVILAVASDALIIGFHVEPDDPAREIIAREGVEVRTYNVIYELANDIKAAVEGMLEPKLKKVFLGRAQVKKVFRLSKAGTVAGCFVLKGKITRQAQVSLLRNGQVIFEGAISSLKRFKDDVREVQEGFECGIALQNFDALQEDDIIEAYELQKIARKI